MYKAQKLVFGRRLTEAQVKKIETLVENSAGIFITDVKSHSVELLVEVNLPQGFVSTYNTLVVELYKEFKIGNVLTVDGEGYILIPLSNTALQSEDMKQDLEEKARKLF